MGWAGLVMKKIQLLIGYCVILVGLNTTLLGSDDISISAAMDKTKVSLNETIVLEVSITGKVVHNIPEPMLPEFEGKLDVVSISQEKIISLKDSEPFSTKLITYILKPKHVGIFIIEPIILQLDQQRLKTMPIKIKVVSANDQIVTDAQPGDDDVQNGGIESDTNTVFVKATTNKSRVLLGEPFVYSVQLFRRTKIWSHISVQQPHIQDAWVEDLLPDEEAIQTINGKRYYVIELLKKKVIPFSEGITAISPIRISFISDPMRGRVYLSTQPKTVSIVPLPRYNQPASFSGGVGDFKINIELDKSPLKLGNPLIAIVTISGVGGLQNVTELTIDQNPTFKLYQSNVAYHPASNIQEPFKKIFKYIIMPIQQEEMTVPPFSFSYFSLKNKKYKTISTSPVQVEIPDSMLTHMDREKKMVQEGETEDIRYLKPVKLSQSRVFYNTPLFWAVVACESIGLCCVLVYYVVKQNTYIRRFFNTDQKNIEKSLKQLLKQRKSDIYKISQTNQLFLEYLTQLTGQSCQQLTYSDLQFVLHSHGVSEALIKKIMRFFLKLSQLIYSPKSIKYKDISYTPIYNYTRNLLKQLKAEMKR